jgi:hypothetical protein
MNNRKSIKQQITEAVLAEIPKSHRIYHQLPIEDVIFKWWFTGRQDGLRLTDEGVTAFQLGEIEFYDHEFKQEGKSYHNFILELNKKIKCPYYIGVNKADKKKSFYLRLYDSKIAMMLNLYGSLQEYLDSVKVRT